MNTAFKTHFFKNVIYLKQCIFFFLSFLQKQLYINIWLKTVIAILMVTEPALGPPPVQKQELFTILLSEHSVASA